MSSKTMVELALQNLSQHTDYTGRLPARLRGAMHRLKICVDINREREALGRLGDDELRDIGVSRGDALTECRRAFFDVPHDRIVGGTASTSVD